MTISPQITVLCGGLELPVSFERYQPLFPSQITAIVNTGDDTVLHGLHISPDLDTITYTLANAIDPDRGWGLIDESWRALDALQRYGQVRPAGCACCEHMVWTRRSRSRHSLLPNRTIARGCEPDRRHLRDCVCVGARFQTFTDGQ